MISYGRWGLYGGQKAFFTHRNPKNGEVWSDDVAVKETEVRGKKLTTVTRYGMWVASDKVKWL